MMHSQPCSKLSVMQQENNGDLQQLGKRIESHEAWQTLNKQLQRIICLTSLASWLLEESRTTEQHQLLLERSMNEWNKP